MKKRSIALLLLSCLVSVGFADEASRIKTAKNVMEKYGDALVSVSAISKTEMNGAGMVLQNQGEREVQTVGTIIDPSGLTVVSYMALDPMSAISSYSMNIGGDNQKIVPKTDLSDVKITLADGTEIDAKLVLKDPDLDLAFIMPEKAEDTELPEFTHIPLDKGGKAEVLDPMIVINRLGKSLDRQCAVVISHVSAVVKKPRTFYVGALELGSPVFNEKGLVLGISFVRKLEGTGNTGAVVAIPAEDVQEIAVQALEAVKKEAEKESDPALAEENSTENSA